MTTETDELVNCFKKWQVIGVPALLCLILAVVLIYVFCTRGRKSNEKRSSTQQDDKKILIDDPERGICEEISLGTLIRENEELRCQRNEMERNMQDLRAKLEELETDKLELVRKLHETEREKQELIRKLGETEREKQAALTRLSEHMSVNLTDNNPNIADLSDGNRPEKIKEQFSELYDNEYTDAQTYLSDKFETNEEDVVTLMLTILKHSFDVCISVATKQLSEMKQLLAMPKMDSETDMPDVIDLEIAQDTATLPKEQTKKIKDLRKSLMPELSVLVKVVEKRFGADYCESPFMNCLDAEPLNVFLKSCVKISWLMAIQDPPMDLNFEERDEVRLRTYTRSGTQFDYMVWPSLYMEKGGALMGKGIAQFREESFDSTHF